MLSSNRVDLGKNIADLEVDPGEVDRNGLDGNPPLVARGQHLADLVDNRQVQAVDQVGVFQNPDKDSRAENAFFRIDPPGQSFIAADLAGQAADLHLVVRLDPALVQGLLEVSQDIVAIDVLFPDAFVKNVIQLS